VLACAAAAAAEPKSLALMDFELIDEMRPFASEQARREVDRRIVLVTAELAKELAGRGMYRVLDRAPAAKLIERYKASYELRACNGCEIDIGKALGAERIALCWVQKVSNLILNQYRSAQRSDGRDRVRQVGRYPRQHRRDVAARAAPPGRQHPGTQPSLALNAASKRGERP
jgi:hypothetical protein